MGAPTVKVSIRRTSERFRWKKRSDMHEHMALDGVAAKNRVGGVPRSFYLHVVLLKAAGGSRAVSRAEPWGGPRIGGGQLVLAGTGGGLGNNHGCDHRREAL